MVRKCSETDNKMKLFEGKQHQTRFFIDWLVFNVTFSTIGYFMAVIFNWWNKMDCPKRSTDHQLEN